MNLFKNIYLYVNYLIKKFFYKKNITIEYLNVDNYDDCDDLICYCASCNFFRFLFTPLSCIFIIKPVNNIKKYDE